MVIKDHAQELFLLEEMKAGKEYAFDFFFNYYYPGLCVYAQNLSSISEEEAKNLVQDVFLKFWNHRKKINIRNSVRSYLFTSIKNKCIDHLKQEKKSFNLNEDFIAETKSDVTFETFVLKELEDLFEASLNKLPERCREIFELSRFEGLKNKEIAAKLNLSEKTVENQMTKALRILKKELKDYLPLFLL